MFRLVQNDSFTWPIRVDIPVDGGRFESATFDAVFKKVPQSRIKDLQKQIAKDGFDDTAMCREILIGWSGIVDEDGEEVPFSQSNRDRLLDTIGLSSAIVMQFFEALRGNRAKN